MTSQAVGLASVASSVGDRAPQKVLTRSDRLKVPRVEALSGSTKVVETQWGVAKDGVVGDAMRVEGPMEDRHRGVAITPSRRLPEPTAPVYESTRQEPGNEDLQRDCRIQPQRVPLRDTLLHSPVLLGYGER